MRYSWLQKEKLHSSNIKSCSDLRFYKIAKVKREVNENVMLKKLQFLYKSNRKFFESICLKRRLYLPQKKNCNKLAHDLLLQRYENEDLDVFGRCMSVKT